jgi:hypothetical protein
MYKDLFKLIVAMIVNPGNTWAGLARKEEKGDEYLTRVVYPLIGLVTLAAFAGVFFSQRHFDWEVALKSAIKELVASFGGFFLSSYILSELWKGMFGKSENIQLCRRFIGYSSMMMYALNILLSLLPVSDFFYLQFFLLYTAYIVWEGAKPYMGIGDEQVKGASAQMMLTILATASIILLPKIISNILFLLMPGLRI